VIGARVCAVTVLATVLLWSQIAFFGREGIQSLPSSWRFWDDTTLGIARYVDATSEAPPMEQEKGELAPLVSIYRELVEEKVRTFEIEPHQFWRTVNDQKFRTRRVPYAAPPFEDPGRGLLLSLGFRVIGGVAPYLLLWLGAIAFIPVLAWVTYELVAAGFSVAAATLGLLIGLSPFFFESLALPHSAIAFYLGALVAVAAFAVAALLRRKGSELPWPALVLRAAFLAAILIVALWCRSSTVFLVPAAFLVAAAGFERGGLPRFRAIALAAAMILLPTLLLRPHQTHNVWLSLWEGLGDFGTDRGYSWYDEDANRFLASQGVSGFADPKDVNATHEATFKKAFLSGVLTSPAWYASVLAKRLWATVGLTKLAPWGPRDGESRSAPFFHYKYTMPIDWFGWKDRLYEVPVAVLYLPSLALLVWTAMDRGRPGGEAGVLATVAAASLPCPLVVSTASGLETQAFGLVYFLGAAFLLQRLTVSLTDFLADSKRSRFSRA